MSNKEGLLPSSNIDGHRRRLPVKEIYSAFYLSQVQNTDSQLYLFFMTLVSLFAQGVAFAVITTIAKHYGESADAVAKAAGKHSHADSLTVIAQVVFAILFVAKLIKTITN